MGKTRIVAETGAGQHGVASATACALLGLECVVYMGTEDMRRQALNVFRMRLLGATVEGVDSGSRTLKDAINEAMRDWVARPDDTHYLLGSALGPHPYPLMVREFQSVIGREARGRSSSRPAGCRDAVIACVGGGSNAIGIFDAFIDDRDVRLDRRRGRRRGDSPGPARGAIRRRRRGRAAGHADVRAAGRERQHRADAFGLGRSRLRGGRSRARVAAGDRAAPSTPTRPTMRRWRRSRSWRGSKGILPALESAHAIAHVSTRREAVRRRTRSSLVNLSGRGDKDVTSVEQILKESAASSRRIDSVAD